MPASPSPHAATIDSLGIESRLFAPPAEFSAQANIDEAELQRLHAAASANPIDFWEQQARRLDWHREWDSVHTWEPAQPVQGSDGSPLTTTEGEPVLSVPPRDMVFRRPAQCHRKLCRPACCGGPG